MQFVEVGEDLAHVVHGVGTLRVTRDLRDLPRRQLGVDVLGQLLAFLARRSISSEMSTAESSCTKRSSSILASSSAMACSKPEKSLSIYSLCSFFNKSDHAAGRRRCGLRLDDPDRIGLPSILRGVITSATAASSGSTGS
jgi:hypothetical protein